jgi:prepilin-type N-terminal cleavage/methylation domain-containing protein
MKYSATIARGFTLIELLIVIALLGALAVGLLATIDPFEQLKKGRDTATRNTVSEFYNANLRYYATKGTFPWGTSTFGATPLNDPTMTSYIKVLMDTGELKSRFIDLAGTGNLAKIYITSTSPESEAVCFQPESKSFQADPNTVFDQTGGTSISNCKSITSSGTSCYFCVQ